MSDGMPPCACGKSSTFCSWEGDTGLRVYACDDCHAKTNKFANYHFEDLVAALEAFEQANSLASDARARVMELMPLGSSLEERIALLSEVQVRVGSREHGAGMGASLLLIPFELQLRRERARKENR